MKLPTEGLIELIAPLLVDGSLFLPEDMAKYKAKISTGTMTPEDWLLAIENALSKKHPE